MFLGTVGLKCSSLGSADTVDPIVGTEFGNTRNLQSRCCETLLFFCD